MKDINNLTLNPKKVVIGLDGTMESSVVAFLLKKQGHECIGIHIDYLGEEFSDTAFKLFSPSSSEDIKKICDALEISFYATKASNEFKEEVVDRMVCAKAYGTYQEVITLKNRMLFRILSEKADKLGAKFIATGHLAKLTKGPSSKRLFFAIPNDFENDESSRLATVDTDCLDRLLFPLAEMKLSEVDKIANLTNIKFNNKTMDSKKLRNSFFYSDEFVNYLSKSLPSKLVKEGSFFSYSERTTIADHEGSYAFSVGQSKLSVKGQTIDKSLVVMNVLSDGNIIIDKESNCSFKLIRLETTLFDESMNITKPVSCFARIGLEKKLSKCVAFFQSGKRALIEFDKPQGGIFPRGTSVTLYSKDKIGGRLILCGELVSCGTINNAEYLQFHKTKEEIEIETLKPKPKALSEFNF